MLVRLLALSSSSRMMNSRVVSGRTWLIKGWMLIASSIFSTTATFRMIERPWFKRMRNSEGRLLLVRCHLSLQMLAFSSIAD